jgi:uncharacterized membrane protein YidH (DUF202 family)
MESTSGAVIEQGLPPARSTKTLPAPEPTAAAWPTALGLVVFAGACLLLYGNAQNSTTGPGPIAAKVGAAVVVTVTALAVVVAMRRRQHERATDRRTGQYFELTCTTCNKRLPGRHRAQESDAFARAVRRHDDEAHRPHDPTILQILAVRIALVQAGTVDLPTTVRRYELAASEWKPV